MKTEIEFEGESAETDLIHFLKTYQYIPGEEICISVEMKCKKSFCNTSNYIYLDTSKVDAFSKLVKNGNYDLGLESLCHECEIKAEKFAEEAIAAL